MGAGFRLNMGLGRLGLNTVNFKRKFRWTLDIFPYCGDIKRIGPNFVKTASRPNWDIEETELNYLNAKTWIAGKHSWQSITVTYIDAAVTEIQNLYSWVSLLGRINNPGTFFQGSKFTDYAAYANLYMYDGCGFPMDLWVLDNVWPQAVNFGELDYTSSEEATIELTLRYDKVFYQNFCGTTAFPECCTPCQVV